MRTRRAWSSGERGRSRFPVAISLLLACLATCGEAWAARLPDWARELLEQAPEIPPGISEDPARVLLRDRRVVIEADGTVTTRLRTARQILSSRRDYDVEYFPFRRDVAVEFSRVWHQAPGGRTTRSGKAAFVDLSIDDAFLTDVRSRMIPIDGLERGSLVFVEIRTRETPFDLALSEVFHSPYPIDRAVFEIALPPGWRLLYDWPRGDGPGPVHEDGVYRWTMTGLRSSAADENGPDPFETSPLLVVGPVPGEGAQGASNAFPGWQQLAGWYERIADGRDEVTDAVRAVAGELASTAGEAGAPAAFARFVRDNIRYLSRNLGIGGYRPETAADTLAQRFGDCKAKATLLRSMLTTVGRESYPVLVSARYADTVSERVPSLDAFDHMILALRATPTDVERYPAAVSEHPELGPLLFVDPTAETVSFGWLPAPLQGRRALIVAGERTSLVDLPDAAAEAHRVRAELRLRLESDRSVAIGARCTFYGQPAAERRWAYRDSSHEYRERWERRLRETWVDASVVSFAVEEETGDGAFVVAVEWTSSQPLGEGSSQRVPVFAGLGAFVPEPALPRRETPVRFEHRSRIELEATLTGLPAGVDVPKTEQSEGAGWSVSTSFREEGGEVSGVGSVVVDRTWYEPEEFRDLRRFYRALDRALDASVWLRR